MKIVVKNLQKRVKINPAKIRKIASDINPPKRFRGLELILYFVSNKIIRRLNRQFFHKNKLTDVISFRLTKKYAEVFIAPCVVKDNAAAFCVPFKGEIARCVIHGILHIFGFKDQLSCHRKKMWQRQEKILEKIIKYDL